MCGWHTDCCLDSSAEFQVMNLSSQSCECNVGKIVNETKVSGYVRRELEITHQFTFLGDRKSL